ncbi:MULTISPECIES: LLM class flavin-dependent oxidoreductase [Pseudonocardia]|uniref:Methanesulfonate monooxygenase n=2 Tax=Pseudonocardia TaxID=1847 RepID=A0A1Y2MHY4_PSEAH|nr:MULTISPECIES: LLM class flavin-dependent oxidoreductase [Pseudonocardia]OSY34579.1 Methanesulfonate monooxygenase [Pseudonocardia autotrophica]TDN71838.1 luciferase-like monooxygenase [Pseudonocardia autotrophica]BBG02526.1 monooxygenase [Pseudonocardia autotrophica]GEC29426.1 monooxygenase [Pseudonocardia saturnea]
MTAAVPRLSVGIMTPPVHVDYADIARVWAEADAVPEIEHAWLYDHLMPIGGPPDGPALEGWTLLSALAARTHRLRMGVLVTSNRLRPAAVLAKIATTVDVISGGRLDLGIGAGSRVGHPLARREYDAHGLPFHDAATAVEALDEACTVLRRLWTETEPFDFHGRQVRLTGAFGSPKPVQRPGPPLLIGGSSTPTLRVVARHADLWNVPADLDGAVARGAVLDRLCAQIGRDPATITRSTMVAIDPGDATRTRDRLARAHDAGFSHLVMGLPVPYPTGIARWIGEEIVAPLRAAGR